MKAMERLSIHLMNRLAVLNKAREEGRKIIGYTPGGYLPEELVLAKEQLERGPFHGSYGEIKRAAEAAQEFDVDGIIFNYLFNCRPMAMLSHLLKQFVERETGIPVLSLEMDMYDSRTYNASALRIRVEAFAEMLRAKKRSIAE